MASYKVVMANGVFDLFHIGHLRYLEAAAAMGDVLAVTVTKDAFVNKGAGRPVYDENERIALVDAVRFVHYALLVNGCIEGLQRVRPNIFVKGREYEGKIEREHEEYCKAHNIEIRFTDTETVRPRARLGQG